MIKDLSPSDLRVVREAEQILAKVKRRLDVTFTQKELMWRWKVSLRTVQREIRRWRLSPVAYTGLQPLFLESAVLEMERRKLTTRVKAAGLSIPTDRIVSVRQAKRLAKGKGRK